MRRLRRPQYTVPTMADSGPGGRRRLADRAEYVRTATVPVSFLRTGQSLMSKAFCYAMQGRICAYCGVATNGLDVEHFRPKGAD